MRTVHFRRKAAMGQAGSNGCDGLDSAFTQKEIVMESANAAVDRRIPWDKGKLIGQKPRKRPANTY